MDKQPDNRQKDGKHKLSGPGPGRPKGSKNKATLLREGAVQKILAEWDRRDRVARKGDVDSWLATLSDRDYKDLAKQIIPKNVEVQATFTIDAAIGQFDKVDE